MLRRRLLFQRALGHDGCRRTIYGSSWWCTDGVVDVLKPSVKVQAGEVVDGTFMSKSGVDRVPRGEQIDDALSQGVLFSVHLKATMMKISDPILFGHAGAGRTSRPSSSATARLLEAVGADPRTTAGAACWTSSPSCPRERELIEETIAEVMASRPGLAMVDSDRVASPTCTYRATSSSMPRCRR